MPHAPPMRAPSLVGQILDGIYRVESILGRGSMGAVYAARDLRTGGLLALKVLSREARQDGEIYARFRNEARITSALRHPGIVQVFHFAELSDGSPYIVMEHLHGEDLQARLRRVPRLPMAEALRICHEVATALHEAHKLGVVHRDLKPGNIFLSRQEQGEGHVNREERSAAAIEREERSAAVIEREERSSAVIERAKIIDFGVSQIRGLLGSEEHTQDSQILGTPQYMSPEVALGLNSQLDGRSDQFSLAVILYRMLAGKLPFDADNQIVVMHLIAYEPPPPIEEILPDLPPPFVAALNRALRKRKEDRFDTVIDFALALRGHTPRHSTQMMVAARRPGSAQHSGPLQPRMSGAEGRAPFIDSAAGGRITQPTPMIPLTAPPSASLPGEGPALTRAVTAAAALTRAAVAVRGYGRRSRRLTLGLLGGLVAGVVLSVLLLRAGMDPRPQQILALPPTRVPGQPGGNSDNGGSKAQSATRPDERHPAVPTDPSSRDSSRRPGGHGTRRPARDSGLSDSPMPDTRTTTTSTTPGATPSAPSLAQPREVPWIPAPGGSQIRLRNPFQSPISADPPPR